MSLETWQAKYPVIDKGQIENLSLRELIINRKEIHPQEFVWSARLSTGLFGLVNCPSGNSSHSPKGENEVMLAVGDEGMQQLIKLGFLPCPTCHPEDQPDFWKKTKGTILSVYPAITDEKQILDRNLIPFDATRIDWEKVAPYLAKMPNRLYVPPNLNPSVLQEFKKRIDKIGFSLPLIGFYDRTSETRFTEYIIKK